MTVDRVTFDIDWYGDNEDDDDDFDDDEDEDDELLLPHKGWYVTLVRPRAASASIGPSFDEDGYATVDDALAAIDRWGTGRGFRPVDKEIIPTIRVDVVK